MKKGLFIVALLCFSGLMMAQETSEQKLKGAHPYKLAENETVSQDFAHWSIIPHIGFNAFDGDFNNEMKHCVSIPNAGLGIEYSFTPVWSIGIDYMFDRYHVTGKPGYDNAAELLNGYMHELGAYVSMDVINLFFPKAKRKIVNIQPLVGAGYSWYRNSVMYSDESRGHTESYRTGASAWSDGSPAGPKSMDGYKGVFFIQGGLNVEFNLSRIIALGVRAQYNYFMNDYVDGRGFATDAALASKNNDGIFDVTLNMRFKLVGRSKTHVRNITSFETWAKGEKQQIVHDTVIIQRDTTIIRETIREQIVEAEHNDVYYVYFDNNKSALDEKALITIQQVADRMTDDTTLYAVVTGYCDNTGSSSLNNALGDRRAAAVINELGDEQGIDASHMYALGMGKIAGNGKSASTYGPNRRAVIRLVDKETFDRLRGEMEETKEMRIEDEKTVPLSVSMKPETVNQYAQRPGTEIKVSKNSSLSKLAREYYNNTHCWVYIYMANKSKMTNPNALNNGTKLLIPELTEEELNTTKDQCLETFRAASQIKR